MRLFRWLFWLVALAAVVWFSTNVQLGKRTLFGHLRAIGGTPEAQDLANGTRDEAEKVADKIRRELRGDGGTSTRHAQPSDDLDDKDRRELERLIRKKAAH